MSQHKWVRSTLGHGESMCEYCKATNREIAVIGDMNHCPDAPPVVASALDYSNKPYGLKVRDFHLAFGQAAPELPTAPSRNLEDFRNRLEWEEYGELNTGVEKLWYSVKEETLLDAWTQIADAIGDILYVVYGRAVSYGLPIDAILQIIHEANMEKLGPNGKPILNGITEGYMCFEPESGHLHIMHQIGYRPDLPVGKVLKPEGWVPPDARIKELLRPLLAQD